ncbi:recombinase family protein [Sphingomonas sp. Leaf357]|uniref:recombinase family protein n=1 Tax=Sphingomonas sp. Leaf357 TaxID=1736350 RepID=UPI0009EC01B1|nr:recombinase family protein [Sphingomonas sp. Leaf357]
MTQPLRAYIYARVSNDDEDGNNASGVAQRAACRAWCEKQGVEVVEEFEELNVSGRKLKRREFDRMIAQATAANRPVQIIVVYMLSRFARRLLTQMTAEHKLDEAGVRLVSVVEDIADDANGRFMRGMIGLINEKYANDASIFTARDRRGNAAAGYWNGGPIPFGYESRVVVTDGRKGRRKLFIVEAEAAVIRLIYELADVGLTGRAMGTRAIAAHLNANGYTFRGKRFFHSNVDGILTREHYSGSYRDRTMDAKGVKPTEEEAIVIACPQIVAPDQIARVAAIRARAAPSVTPPRVTNSPVLLGGIATCGHPECGSGMVLRTGKGGAYRYYVCNRKATAGAATCPSKAIREAALDSIVLDGLLDRVLQPDRLKVLLADVLDRSDDAEKRRKDDLDRVRRERIAAEARLRRLLELVEEGLMSPRDPIFGDKLAEGRSSITALTETERSLQTQLGACTRVIDDASVERFGAMLRAEILGENAELRRSYVRMLIGDVSVNDNEIVIAGSTAALEAAATSGSLTGATAVRGFDRKWCRLQDSNL